MRGGVLQLLLTRLQNQENERLKIDFRLNFRLRSTRTSRAGRASGSDLLGLIRRPLLSGRKEEKGGEVGGCNETIGYKSRGEDRKRFSSSFLFIAFRRPSSSASERSYCAKVGGFISLKIQLGLSCGNSRPASIRLQPAAFFWAFIAFARGERGAAAAEVICSAG